MLIVLSPAKTLDFVSPIPNLPVTEPRFVQEAAALVRILRGKNPSEIASLMNISEKLASLNAERFAGWSSIVTAENGRPAILAFNGDVYEGLGAAHLTTADLEWAQNHIAILSGLYGLLRPLDLMQPYRLEMGTKLANPNGKDLYAYWGTSLSKALHVQLQNHANPLLVNLASDEYFSAVSPKTLGFPVIQPVFQDGDAGKYKIISFYAKRARGLMARFAITHRISDPEQLKGFDVEGYRYAPEASDSARWIFRRSKPTKGPL